MSTTSAKVDKKNYDCTNNSTQRIIISRNQSFHIKTVSLLIYIFILPVKKSLTNFVNTIIISNTVSTCRMKTLINQCLSIFYRILNNYFSLLYKLQLSVTSMVRLIRRPYANCPGDIRTVVQLS